MYNTRKYGILIIAILSAGTLCIISPGYAQDYDIQTTYSTKKGACNKGRDTLIEISEGLITGPGFVCTISSGNPAGTGLVAYDGNCTINGRKIMQGPAIDLGNYSDHFRLSLPGTDAWIKLYPCRD